MVLSLQDIEETSNNYCQFGTTLTARTVIIIINEGDAGKNPPADASWYELCYTQEADK